MADAFSSLNNHTACNGTVLNILWPS